MLIKLPESVGHSFILKNQSTKVLNFLVNPSVGDKTTNPERK